MIDVVEHHPAARHGRLLDEGSSPMMDHGRTVASYEAEPTTRQGGAMPSQEQVSQWVDGYRTAWESNDPEDIGRLFTEQALYSTEPHATPWRGRQAIVDGWIGIKDEPGDTDFSWELLATDGDLAIVQGQTLYHNPLLRYSNLWLIRLDPNGQATEFTEWWMQHDDE
jgi:SnoaL-like domain